MKTTDIYLVAILAATFLTFASFYNNPLSFTTGLLIAITLTLIFGFNKQLSKDNERTINED